MRLLSLAALGAVLIVLSGCVAYPIDRYPARADQGVGRDQGDNRGHDNRRGPDRRDDDNHRGPW